MNLEKLKIQVRNKKAVILDLDNTLYEYQPCHKHALRTVYGLYCRKVKPVSFEFFLKQYEKARGQVHQRLKGTASSHSRLLYFQILLEGKAPVSETLEFEKKYWDSFLKQMRLEHWVRPFLDFCRKEKKKICIVTNLTSAIQMSKLKKFKIDVKIDYLVTSEEAGHEKPHPAIFRLALQKLNSTPRDIFCLGDDPKTDRLRL